MKNAESNQNDCSRRCYNKKLMSIPYMQNGKMEISGTETGDSDLPGVLADHNTNQMYLNLCVAGMWMPL